MRGSNKTVCTNLTILFLMTIFKNSTIDPMDMNFQREIQTLKPALRNKNMENRQLLGKTSVVENLYPWVILRQL